MRYAYDNGDLQNNWRTCKGCDCDMNASMIGEDGLCDECRAKKEEAESEDGDGEWKRDRAEAVPILRI